MGGIDAQYGFLYQKYVYILTILQNLSMGNTFKYEGKDDVDIDTKDLKDGITIIKNTYIQAKSGVLSKEEWIQCISNWIEMSELSPDARCVIYIQNNIDEKWLSENFINIFIEEIKKYNEIKKRQASSVKKRIYDKYKNEFKTDEFLNKLYNLLRNVDVNIQTEKNLKDLIIDIYKTKYCSDIKIYELAKTRRAEAFINEIMRKIDQALLNKKSLSLDFTNIIEIVNTLASNITDTTYKLDHITLKAKFRKKAKKIVSRRNFREVLQLEFVNNNESFIIEKIIRELMYKDMRDVYGSSIDIRNIEDEAHSNYMDVLFELSDEEKCSPKKVYVETTKRDIDNNFFNKSKIYREGCYIFLTGNDVAENLKISWKVEE